MQAGPARKYYSRPKSLSDAGNRDHPACYACQMREHGIRHLPVAEPGRHPGGIFSDRDLRRADWVDEVRDLVHGYYPNDDMLVRDVMMGRVQVVHTGDTLRKARRSRPRGIMR